MCWYLKDRSSILWAFYEILSTCGLLVLWISHSASLILSQFSISLHPALKLPPASYPVHWPLLRRYQLLKFSLITASLGCKLASPVLAPPQKCLHYFIWNWNMPLKNILCFKISYTLVLSVINTQELTVWSQVIKDVFPFIDFSGRQPQWDGAVFIGAWCYVISSLNLTVIWFSVPWGSGIHFIHPWRILSLLSINSHRPSNNSKVII